MNVKSSRCSPQVSFLRILGKLEVIFQKIIFLRPYAGKPGERRYGLRLLSVQRRGVQQTLGGKESGLMASVCKAQEP